MDPHAVRPWGICIFQVDAHNVVPVWTTSDKQETMARTIRPKIHARPDFLGPIPELTPNAAGTKLPAATDWEQAQASLDLDKSVPGKEGKRRRRWQRRVFFQTQPIAETPIRRSFVRLVITYSSPPQQHRSMDMYDIYDMMRHACVRRRRRRDIAINHGSTPSRILTRAES